MVKSPHHVSKDLFGESQPAAARKPVAKSLFKEPSAPLETRAQVSHTQPNMFLCFSALRSSVVDPDPAPVDP